MTHQHQIEAKLRELLPANWATVKRSIAIEFCQAYGQDSTEWTSMLFSTDATDELLDSEPLLQMANILSPISFQPHEDSAEAWRHFRLKGAGVVQHISLDELSDCAGRYLSQSKYSSPTLELWLSRKMIYEESFAFQEEAAPHLERRTFLRKVEAFGPAVSELLILLSSLWLASVYDIAIGFSVYMVLHACWLAKRYQDKRQLQPLLKAMSRLQRAYDCAMQPLPSPSEVDRALANAESVDAAWPHRLRDLAELAKRRSLFRWA